MAKNTLADVSTKLYALLEPLDSAQRKRTISAVLILLGDEPLAGSSSGHGDAPGQESTAVGRGERPANSPNGGDAKQFFDSKQPKEKRLTKIEELAIAA